MNTCPSCSSDVKESYKFCPSCSMQLKCSECNERLLPGKSFCFACGSSIQQRQESSKAQLNEFLLEEKRTKTSASRVIKGNLSDNAFSQAVTLLGVLPPTQIVQSPKKVVNYEQGVLPSPDFNHEYLEQNIETLPSSNQVEPSIEAATQNLPEETKVLKYFKQHGDNEIVPKISDFKGKTKKDQQERFIVLYTWAYNEVFKSLYATKQKVIDASRNSGLGIYDKNIHRYYDQLARKFFMKAGDGFELNALGSAEIEKILKDLDNKELEGVFYWETNTRPSSKSNNSNKDEQQVEDWAHKEVNIGKIKVGELGSATNYALFTTWLLTTQLKVVNVVKPKTAFLYLKRKFETSAVKDRNFTEAFGRKSNGSLFKKNADGLYYLSELGKKKVESWLETGEISNKDEQLDVTE